MATATLKFDRTAGQILDTTGRVVASVHGDTDEEEGRLGAMLAASPEMLVFIKAEAESELPPDAPSHALARHRILKARALIAKATGSGK